MAHYAFINPATMKVREVIVGIDETEEVDGITGTEGWEAFYETQRPGLICRRTSYNGNIRGRFAAVGCVYVAEKDTFVTPPPSERHRLDLETLQWVIPKSDIEDCECGAEWSPATNEWICLDCSE